MSVRWSLRYRLSAADVRDLLAERGVDVAARTVLYWVQQFAPLLARAGRRAATRPGRRWWCDDTSVRVGGQWASLYRAIDAVGQVVECCCARTGTATARGPASSSRPTAAMPCRRR